MPTNVYWCRGTTRRSPGYKVWMDAPRTVNVLFVLRLSFLAALVKMRLRLASAGVAMAAVTLSGQSVVSALRSSSEQGVKAMEVNDAAAVDCTEGQKTLAIKVPGETASFRCGQDAVLAPEFAATDMKAYTSPTAETPVVLTSIVPKATFTKTPAAPSVPGENGKQDGASPTTDATYHLNAPELPAEEKVVVFKCMKKSAGGGQAADSGTKRNGAEGTSPTPSEPACVMTINVAKSAASKKLNLRRRCFQALPRSLVAVTGQLPVR